MLKSFFLLFTVFICITSQSCKVNQKTERPESAIEALVIRSDLSGCDWMIRTAEGHMLNPDKLDVAFQKDKLEVWLTYQIDKGRVSVCMSGKPVIISFIDIR